MNKLWFFSEKKQGRANSCLLNSYCYYSVYCDELWLRRRYTSIQQEYIEDSFRDHYAITELIRVPYAT